jgi:CBS-domain-containing membrane protein
MLRNYPVVSIEQNASLLDAFVRIYRTGVTGIGVRDAEGHLVGAVSASDLKLLGYSPGMFRKLFIPVKDWINMKAQKTTVRSRSSHYCQSRHALR